MRSPNGNVPGTSHSATPTDPYLGMPLVSLPGEKGENILGVTLYSQGSWGKEVQRESSP